MTAWMYLNESGAWRPVTFSGVSAEKRAWRADRMHLDGFEVKLATLTESTV